MKAFLVIRPEPGASETVARASALGLFAVPAPLFTVTALHWEAPDPADFDAVLMTSANAGRHGGDALRTFASLPCYAVGEATAMAAKEAGFQWVAAGNGGGQDALALAEQDGKTRILHLCGRDHLVIERPDLSVQRRPVYAVEPVETLPGLALDALRKGAAILLHSPRAAAHFADLFHKEGLERSAMELIAISEATAQAAGEGWRAKHIARIPRDEALLELAVKLCQTDFMSDGAER